MERTHGKFAIDEQRMKNVKRTICEALRIGKGREEAAIAGGITRRTLHRWLRADAEFSKAFVDAQNTYRLKRAA